jgi:pyridoxal biosynthesis lyase PdxS
MLIRGTEPLAATKTIDPNETLAEQLNKIHEKLEAGFTAQLAYTGTTVLALQEQIKKLEKKVEELEKDKKTENISDAYAKEKIVELLKKLKAQGKLAVNVFEIRSESTL